MKGINWDNMTLDGVPLADILEQPQSQRHLKLDAVRGIQFSDDTVRPSIFILHKLPQLGDPHPTNQGDFVTAYGLKWEDREWAKGWLTYSDGEHEYTGDFWIPKDAPKGLKADVKFDELG